VDPVYQESVPSAGAPARRRAPRPVAETREQETVRGAVAERHDGRRAAVAVIASRLVAFASAFAATYWLGARLAPKRLSNPEAVFDRHSLGFILGAWRHWDSIWFIRIAEHGYSPYRAAFFPLYPALLILGHRVSSSYDLVGITISLACYAGAMVLLYRMVRDDLGSRVALWSVVFISFASTSLFFQAVYSESLFLFLTVAGFAAARRGHWWLAGLAGLLAALTRSAGILLLVPFAWMWFEQRRGRTLDLPGARAATGLLSERRAPLLSLASLLLVPAGLGIYMAYTWQRFGNPLLFMVAERHWHRHMGLPTAAVVDGTRAFARSAQAIVHHPHLYFDFTRLPFHDQWLVVGNLTAFLALVFAVAALVLTWRRLPAAYTVYAVAALLLPLLYPTHSTPLLSMPRFVLVDFPLFVGLAAALAGRPVARAALLAVMTFGLVLLTAIFATGMWVA
jgi:hypothetical protein